MTSVLCDAPIALAALTIGGLAGGWKGAAAGFVAGSLAEVALNQSTMCGQMMTAAREAERETKKAGKRTRDKLRSSAVSQAGAPQVRSTGSILSGNTLSGAMSGPSTHGATRT